jgi:hypothetical protein
MIQERFDETVDLIQRQGIPFCFLRQLVTICRSTVLVFSFFNKPSRGNTRQNVLAAYRLRAEMGKGREHAEGYRELIAALKKTTCTHICVSLFVTEAGTFTVFSDFGREQLIGALFVTVNPLEPAVFSHLFMNGRLLSPERG